MVIILPGETVETSAAPGALTPKQIVGELDRFIVGQNAAKRAVAIALRNRWRRQQLTPELREEIAPKNIVMIGPTGVGKTEIARRLARLAHSPFLKIEASKFTEVGYVGRDVESIIRDLTELGVKMVREEKELAVRAQAERAARERLVDLLLPPPPASSRPAFIGSTEPPEVDSHHETREKMAHWLDEGKLEDREVEMEVREQSFPSFEIFSSQGVEEMGVNMKDMLPGLFGGRTRRQKMRVGEAREILIGEEAAKLVDQTAVTREALERVEQHGIVFLDEIDKVAGRESGHGGPDVSREGVQRDLLPIVEGTTVNTRYGMIRTDHILFIAAGAFHVSKPSDLIPELQGRFPIRVELDSLSQDDFKRILREPHNALTRQYSELLATEGVQLRFTDEAVAEIARLAASVNERTENIGARRLQTILERVLDDLSFDANERGGDEVVIDAEYVRKQVEPILRDEDLSRYIL